MSDAKTLRLFHKPFHPCHAFLPQPHALPHFKIGNLGLAGAKQPSQSAQGRPQPGSAEEPRARGAGVPRSRRASRVPRGLGRCLEWGRSRAEDGRGHLLRPMSPLEGLGGLHQGRKLRPGPAKTPRPPRSLLARPHLGAMATGTLRRRRRTRQGHAFPTVEGLGGGSAPEKIRVPP